MPEPWDSVQGLNRCVFTFVDVQARDAWLNEHYPNRTAAQVLGLHTTPSGHKLDIRTEKVTVYMPDTVRDGDW